MRIEHWVYTVPLRLRSLLRRRQVERELDEELRYHVERQTEELVARGMPPDGAARRRGVRRLLHPGLAGVAGGPGGGTTGGVGRGLTD